MKDNQSLIERIALYIPIYRGYKQKNLRRDEDRAVRQEVARALEGTKIDLGTIHRAVIDDPGLMRDVDRIRAKVDRYHTSVKKAVNGYSGWHASVKIMEAELEMLIRWDAALIDGVKELREETAALLASVDAGEYAIKADLRKLEGTVDFMTEQYNQRDAVMRGFAEDKE
ncbi:MAG: hypothetical protein GX224_00970 [Thermoplasmatales archaeon]|nr:hypothetical protein [Thermoplasmatales archaeon]